MKNDVLPRLVFDKVIRLGQLSSSKRSYIYSERIRKTGEIFTLGTLFSRTSLIEGWSDGLIQAKLRNGWSKVVGDSFVDNIKFIRVEGDIITVEACDTVWKNQVLLYQSQIVENANNLLTYDRINSIQVKLSTSNTATAPPGRRGYYRRGNRK